MRLRLLFFGEFAVCSTASAKTGERMKPRFWRSDWFLGLACVVLVTLFSRFSDLIPELELKAYDLGVNASARVPSDKVAVIAIDKQSIDNIGRWPWPRDVHAKMVGLLAKGNAKVVSYGVFFDQPENQRATQTISRLLEAAGKGSPATDRGDLLSLLREAED